MRPWRLDVRVLRNESAKTTLSNLIKQSLVGMRPTPATWDHLKGRWRDLCSMQGRHLRADRRVLLQDTIIRMRIVRRGGASTSLMQTYLAQLQQRYQCLLRTDTTASTVSWVNRCPATHPEVLRYSRRAQRPGSSAPLWNPAPVPSTSIPTDTVHLPTFASHFRALAQAEDEASRPELLDHPFLCGLPTVPDDFGSTLEQCPSPAELQHALSRMKSGSAPGPDGLPTEFYKTFWPVLCDFFLRRFTGFL